MIFKKSLSFVLVLLIAVSLMAIAFSASAEDNDKISEMLGKMTTEQKITQMLMPTFRYWQEDGGEKSGLEEINSDIEGFIKKYGFAGVILYSQSCKSTEKTTRFIDDMQKANASAAGKRPALLTSVDQEGGVVARLATGSALCGNMALGAAGDPSYSKAAASIMGSELSAIGFNVDFAPVVDVNNNAANPVIGIRSFSDDPGAVSENACSFIQGLHKNNIAASLKHFPGHGNTDTDSHTGLPVVNSTYEELKKCELLPFGSAIKEGAEMIMTAHIEYPNIEKDTYVSKETGKKISLPATLSKTILTDILRKDMGYNGIIITDAMNMDAVAKHFDKYDAAKLAINAGVDILLTPTETSSVAQLKETEEYIAKLVEMTNNGDIEIDKVNKSVERILKLKEKQGLLDGYKESDIEEKIEAAKSVVGCVDNHNKEWEITKRGLTLVKNDDNTLPIKNGEKTVVLAANADGQMSMNYAVGLLKDNKKLDDTSAVIVDTYNKKTADETAQIIKGADNVVIFTRMFGTEDLDPKTEDGETFKLVDDIIDNAHKGGSKVTVVSCYLPYDVARFQKADAIMVAYGSKIMSEDPRTRETDLKSYGPNMPAALYTVFDSGVKPTAKLPVNIPMLNDDYSFSDKNLYERGYGLTYADKTLNDKKSLLGDADGDGRITVGDATDIQKYIAKINMSEGFNADVTDVDGNGRVNVVDATCIQKYIAKLKAPEGIGKQIFSETLLEVTINTEEKGGYYTGKKEKPGIIRNTWEGMNQAFTMKDGKAEIDMNKARPSFCSSACYMALLKALSNWDDNGTISERSWLNLRPYTIDGMDYPYQNDGVGCWGRANANGPGMAVLVAQLGAGFNMYIKPKATYPSYEEYYNAWKGVKAGDILKLFWNEYVGADDNNSEAGHLVIFQRMEDAEDENGNKDPVIYYWSSNGSGYATDKGYSIGSSRLSKIYRAVATRITKPYAFNNAEKISPDNVDQWLSDIGENHLASEEELINAVKPINIK